MILERSYYGRLKDLVLNQLAVSGPKGLKAGTKITEKVLSDFTPGQWRQIAIKNDKRQLDLERSEEHTSELKSLMRISHAVICVKKKKQLYLSLHKRIK